MGSKAGVLNLLTIWLAMTLVMVSSAFASNGITSLYEKYSPEKQLPVKAN
jgi:hypothetical protein